MVRKCQVRTVRCTGKHVPTIACKKFDSQTSGMGTGIHYHSLNSWTHFLSLSLLITRSSHTNSSCQQISIGVLPFAIKKRINFAPSVLLWRQTRWTYSCLKCHSVRSFTRTEVNDHSLYLLKKFYHTVVLRFFLNYPFTPIGMKSYFLDVPRIILCKKFNTPDTKQLTRRACVPLYSSGGGGYSYRKPMDTI